MVTGKFEVVENQDGTVGFRLKAGNNRVIMRGENFQTKQHVLMAIEAVKRNAGNATRFVPKSVGTDKSSFELQDENGVTLGVSNEYNTVKSRDNGIQSVMKTVSSAVIKEVMK